jgi:hypothetical protein
MSWAVRKLQDNGRLAVVDVIYGPKPEIEDAQVTRAEFLFRKPAGALFARRMIAAGLLDPTQRDHVAVAVRSIRTVAGASKDNDGELYSLVYGVAKNISAPVNTRWSYDLNGFHHDVADRMESYYRKAVTDTKNPPVQ